MVIKNFVTLTLINIRFVSVVMIKHCIHRWGSNIIDEKTRIKKYIGIRDRHLVEIINEKVVEVTVT
jgi:hypothetical protein